VLASLAGGYDGKLPPILGSGSGGGEVNRFGEMNLGRGGIRKRREGDRDRDSREERWGREREEDDHGGGGGGEERGTKRREIEVEGERERFGDGGMDVDE